MAHLRHALFVMILSADGARVKHLTQAVCNQIAGVSRTERARSLRKFLILQAQHLRAGDNAHLHPAGQHERKDDRPGLDDLPGVHDVHIVGHAGDHAEVMRDADGKLP